MTKEFNLSEKKHIYNSYVDGKLVFSEFGYPEKEIKEFIKMSNDDLDLVRTGKMSISKFIRKFKQRAGDDLI